MKTKPQTLEEWMELNCHQQERIITLLEEKFKSDAYNLATIGLINTRDLCLMLTVSEKTVAHWRSTGELAYIKKANRYYYRLDDVRKMMTEGFVRN